MPTSRAGLRAPLALALAVALAASAPAPLAAQGGAVHAGCQSQTMTVRDACQVAVDVFSVMAPQLTGAFAGGEPLIGGSRGFARFVVALRATGVDGFLPDLDARDFSTTGPQQSTIATERQPVPAPVLDVGLGLFRGVQLGVGTLGSGRVGSLSVIGNLSYLPEVDQEEILLETPDGGFKVGLGARLGLLEGVSALPDLAVTVQDRSLPTVNIASVSDVDSVSVDGLSLRTTSWRLLASKRFSVLGLTVGAGQDRSRTGASVSATVQDELTMVTERSTPVRLDQSLTRSSMFAGLSLGLGPVSMAAEVGRMSGASVATYNTFADASSSEARLYGSAGLRLAF